MIIPPTDLQEIKRLQDQNLNLQAYDVAKKFGPFAEWEGTRALLAASGLAYSLGAVNESYRLAMRAWHRDKTDPEATFFYAIETLQRRGPLHTLLFMRRYPDLEADGRVTAWWYSLNGQVRSMMREFGLAETWHERAIKASPTEPWVWTSRSYSLEQQDRYDEALEYATRALELDPKKRSSVASVAHFLILLGRDSEALDLLEKTATTVENGWIFRELAGVQSELGMLEQARSSLERCFELLPLIDERSAEWLYGSLSDTVYLLGETDLAIECAIKASNNFHRHIAESLKNAAAGAKRVVLDVGFIRQHHVTCAPATLSNLARYWERQADHLEVVEEICYDGTPSYKERAWAETNGWRTREFTLNWTDATALLDRGVPMTLATVHPGGGHLQAIIGYDGKRGTYLIRDPYYRNTGEVLAEPLLEDQRSTGPRVMALVPAERADLIDDLGKELFESAMYDLVYEIERSLEKHDRRSAGEFLKRLNEEHPGHRLAIVAQWSVANYDSNNPMVYAALQDLLAKYPDDVNLRQ